MIYSVRDIELLRLLRWCRYIAVKDLRGVFDDTTIQNLKAAKLIRQGTSRRALALTAKGNALVSKLLEKAEDQAISRFGGWYERHKEKFSFYIPIGLILWYVYGLFLNSLKLGIDQTFHDPDHTITTIWVWNPFRNLLMVLTPFGLVTTAVIALLACLMMKKGYNRFSGYKYTHDSRGFDILPDATHGSSGFLTEKEMREFLELGTVREVTGMMLGKTKRHPDDPDLPPR